MCVSVNMFACLGMCVNVCVSVCVCVCVCVALTDSKCYYNNAIVELLSSRHIGYSTVKYTTCIMVCAERF